MKKYVQEALERDRRAARSLLFEAVDYKRRSFLLSEEVSGADLVDWFAQWRQRAAKFLKEGEALS